MISTNILLTPQVSSRYLKKTWLLALIFSFVLILSIFLLTMSVQAQSGGGVGSGGSGGAAGSGAEAHWTNRGWGWAIYSASGSGPSDGFRNGSSWSSAQSTCQSAGASQVYAHIIMDNLGKGMVYDYKSVQDGPPMYSAHFTAGTSVDKGRATAINTSTAQSAFNNLGSYGVSTAGYTFGNNVGWFCYNYTPPPSPNGSCSVNAPATVAVGSSFTASFTANNTGNTVWSVHPTVGDRFKLGSQSPQDNNTWGTSRVELQGVPSGYGDVVYSGTSTGPRGTPTFTAPATPGTYSFNWRVLREGVAWYGPTCTDSIVVFVPDNPPTGTLSANCSTISWTVADPQGTPSGRITISGYSDISFTGSGSTAYPIGPKGDGNSHVVTLYVRNVGALGPTEYNRGSVTVPSCDIPPAVSLARNCDPLVQSVTLTVTDPDGQPVNARYRIGSWVGGTWVYRPWQNVSIPNPTGFITISMSDTPISPNPYINQYDLHRVDAESTGRLLNGSPGKPASLVTATIGYDYDGTVGGTRACRDRNFGLEAVANKPTITPDDAPTQATFTTSGRATLNLDAKDVAGANKPTQVTSAQLTRSHYIRRGPTHVTKVNITNTPLPAVPLNINVPISTAYSTVNTVTRGPTLAPTANPGDKICHTIKAAPPNGTVDTAGNITSPPTPYSTFTPDSEECEVVVNKPYFKVYNSDITAGFAPTCSGWPTAASSGSILGYNDGAGKGSGTQLAAFALSNINEFSSATGRALSATPSKPPKGLTFSNVTVPFGAPFGAGFCSPNYFANKPTAPPIPTPPVHTLALPTLFAGSDYSYSSNVIIVASGAKIPINNKIRVFVEGDVFIEDNIEYLTAGWSSPSVIPSFSLVVKGNIYINKNVEKLDGFYIAQPADDGTKGEVYTCAVLPFIGATTGAQLNTDCNKQLKVNGAVNARRIRLQRTIGSLKYSSDGEFSTSTTAAEQFIFSPEVWLNPALNNGSNDSEYDSVTSAPPTL